MVSTLLMLRRVVRALRYAVREEEFLPILSAGLALVVIGTVAYAPAAARSAFVAVRTDEPNAGADGPATGGAS